MLYFNNERHRFSSAHRHAKSHASLDGASLALIDLNREFAAILQMPDIRERHAEFGAVITGGTPEQFALLVKAEVGKFARLAKAARIRPE